jgi:hypothetical protein
MSINRYKNIPFLEQFNFKLKVDLQVSDEVVNFTTYLITENKELSVKNIKQTTIFNFNELKSRLNSGGLDRWILEINENAEHLPIKNLYAETAITKIEGIEYSAQVGKPSIFHIIIRPEDTSFNDAFICIYVSDESEVICNQEFSEIDRVRTPVGKKTYLPKYDIIKISDDANETLIRLNAPSTVNETFYVKSNLGFVPSKFEVTKGVGEFSFSKIGMKEEDVATIKIGLKYFSNLISLDINK